MQRIVSLLSLVLVLFLPFCFVVLCLGSSATRRAKSQIRCVQDFVSHLVKLGTMVLDVVHLHSIFRLDHTRLHLFPLIHVHFQLLKCPGILGSSGTPVGIVAFPI